MSLPLGVLAATSGNLVGSLIAYGLGATRLLERLPGIRRVLVRWDRLIDRQGLRAVFVARLLPLARTFVSLPAGARRLPLVPFVVLTTLGCAIWAVAFVLLGMASGTAWSAISSVFGKVVLGGVIVLGVTAAVRRITSRPDSSDPDLCRFSRRRT